MADEQQLLTLRKILNITIPLPTDGQLLSRTPANITWRIHWIWGTVLFSLLIFPIKPLSPLSKSIKIMNSYIRERQVISSSLYLEDKKQSVLNYW